ncbi:hypothetical protein B7463_g8432, partial [Scytalidium lignicola]
MIKTIYANGITSILPVIIVQASFFHDLPEIHKQTFKKGTIQNAFKKASIWPVDKEATFTLMKKYIKDKPKTMVKELELPTLRTLTTIQQVQYQLEELKPKIIDLLSSPSQRKFDYFTYGSKSILDESKLIKLEQDIAYRRIQDLVAKKPFNRKRLQKGGELTDKQALTNKERKDQKATWVAWYKKEALRKKAIKQLPRDVIWVLELYKEHTPPPFIEPSKEPIDQKPSITPPTDLADIPFHRPPQTPIQQLIRTNFAKPEPPEELQQEEVVEEGGVSDASMESYIRLDLEGEIGYSSSNFSDSGDSLDLEELDESGYVKLW